jgi:hypothetical protein
MDDRVRCAEESRARSEPLIGTASRVTSWVALEQPGPWGPEPVVDSHLEHWLSATLLRRAKDHRVRLLLIRRPGWQKPDGGLRCYLGRSGRERRWLEALDLDAAADLADLDWSVMRRGEAPGLGRAVDEPLYLVCTHGRHDPCCADHGRPLVAALVAAGIPVWESTHVGGDRFAGNLVCLPEGVYFGRVPPATGPDIVAAYEAGRLVLDHFRGRSCDPPLVQAAELYARQATGADGRDAVALESVIGDGADRAAVSFLVSGSEGGPSRWKVHVSRQRADADEQLSCHAHRRAVPWRYRLDRIDSR